MLFECPLDSRSFLGQADFDQLAHRLECCGMRLGDIGNDVLPSVGTGIPKSCADQPGGDPRRLEDDRQPAARVRPAPDEIDRFQVLEPIAGPEVEHLATACGPG